MLTTEPASQDPSLEECIDELDARVSSLDAYPPELIAYALRTQLAALLLALQQGGIWTADNVRVFLEDLGREASHES